jgi:hypothetical protein
MTGMTSRSVAALLTVIILLAACDAASTSPSPSPAAAAPGATSPQVTLAPPSHSSATLTPAEERTSAPTSAALVLGGSWVSPKAGASLTSYTTTLSATPTASGPGVTTFTKVVFSATWAGAAKTVMCNATRAAGSGAWTCTANLLALGVGPGKVTFSFDVYGAGVPIARSPAGPRLVTYAVPPPRPTNTHWERIQAPDFESGDNTATYRLRWSASAGYADEFLVYETWECPRKSKQNDGTPCFVAGTPVDVSKLGLRARTPGNARSVDVGLTEGECNGHGTILLRARNAYGRSVFAIVEAVNVHWPVPNEVIC